MLGGVRAYVLAVCCASALSVCRCLPELRLPSCPHLPPCLQVRRRDQASKKVVAEECRYDTTGEQFLKSQEGGQEGEGVEAQLLHW